MGKQMPVPLIRYAVSKGARIAYQQYGEGAVDLIGIPPAAQNVEMVAIPPTEDIDGGHVAQIGPSTASSWSWSTSSRNCRYDVTAGMTVSFVAIYVRERADGTIEVISLDLDERWIRQTVGSVTGANLAALRPPPQAFEGCILLETTPPGPYIDFETVVAILSEPAQ